MLLLVKLHVVQSSENHIYMTSACWARFDNIIADSLYLTTAKICNCLANTHMQ